MKTISRTRMVGGSLMIRIPKDLVKAEHLKEGELVEIQVEKIKKNFFGAAKGVGKFTIEDEMNHHD